MKEKTDWLIWQNISRCISLIHFSRKSHKVNGHTEEQMELETISKSSWPKESILFRTTDLSKTSILQSKYCSQFCKCSKILQYWKRNCIINSKEDSRWITIKTDKKKTEESTGWWRNVEKLKRRKSSFELKSVFECE